MIKQIIELSSPSAWPKKKKKKDSVLCLGWSMCRSGGVSTQWSMGLCSLNLQYLLPKGGEVIPLFSFPGRKTP